MQAGRAEGRPGRVSFVAVRRLGGGGISDEGVCVKVRGREGEKGTGVVVTLLRTPRVGCRCRRCSGGGDRR